MDTKVSKKLKIGVLGSTRGKFQFLCDDLGSDLQAIIDKIEANELQAEISIVISNKKDAFILERATKHNIPIFHVDYVGFHNQREEAEKEIIKKLHEKNVELVLLIGWMKILTPVLVSAFRGRIWNIHPSLLPKYAGGMDLNVHKTILDNKETESGCTLHEVTEEVDGGKIIMQKKVVIADGETPDTLKEKVQKLEQECFVESIQLVIDHKIKLG